MIPSPRPAHLAALSAIAAVIAAAPRAHADETTDYVVKRGDTCISVAVRELGNRAELATLHRLNPQLGRAPHKLTAGQILKVPQRRVTPDAHLSSAVGEVRVRKPAETAWDAARRGMALFRAWRVGAEQRSSAEVTFRDSDRLQLRENTIVIIYGPTADRTRAVPAKAVLEQGTLRTRLAELSPTLTVATPSATATLGAGAALIGVAAGGASTVANHDGGTIALVGRAGGRVAVRAGMGSRVQRGKRPEKPRPLPPPPRWDGDDPLAFAAVSADGATIVARWQPEPVAARYRLEILGAGGGVVASAEVPAAVDRFELVRVPVGDYQARIASIDAAGLEGKPGALRSLRVLPVTLRPPGADTGERAAAPPAPADSDRPLAGGAAPPPASAATGAMVGDDDVRCASGDAAGPIATLTAGGAAEVRCSTADGLALAPFTVLVVPITAAVVGGEAALTLPRDAARDVTIRLTSDAPVGADWRAEADPGVLVERTEVDGNAVTIGLRAAAGAPATAMVRVRPAAGGPPVATLAIRIPQPTIEAPPPPPVVHARPRPIRTWTGGGLVGWSDLPTGTAAGTALGQPEALDLQPEGGLALGGRLGRWFGHRLFVELELLAISSDRRGATENVWLLGGRGYLGVRLNDERALEGRLLLGGGGLALLGADEGDGREAVPSASWGLTAAVPLGRHFSLRLDGRHHLVPARSRGLTQVIEATVGFEGALLR
jgi:hypothetical protein